MVEILNCTDQGVFGLVLIESSESGPVVLLEQGQAGRVELVLACSAVQCSVTLLLCRQSRLKALLLFYSLQKIVQ